jgi:putative flippase GtrA
MVTIALKLCRFALVGLSSTLLYALFVALLLSLGAEPLLAVHCIAFALAIPYAYFAQRGFTFRYTGPHADALSRFLITTLVGFLLSTGVVAAAQALHYSDVIAVAAVVVLVPAFNFLCMLSWVFAERDRSVQMR